MNAKKAKELRRIVRTRYKDPRVAEFVYKQAKKELKLGK